MEDTPTPANNNRYIDAFELDQEKDKWQKRAAYVLVILIRLLVAGSKFFLNILKAVGAEILRTFKLIP